MTLSCLPRYADDVRRPPAAAQPRVPVDRAAGAPPAAGPAAAAATEVTGPLLGEGRVGDARPRPDPAARRRSRWASGSSCTAGCCDGDGRPVPHTLVEIWQANAAGRYRHGGRRPAGAAGPELHRRRPGADRRRGPLPVRHDQARARTRGATTTTPGGRRTSTSRCSAGRSPSGWSPRCTSRTTRCSPRTRSSTRSATRSARERMVSRFDHARTEPEWALGYGSTSCCAAGTRTPFEDDDDDELTLDVTPAQTVGPFLSIGLTLGRRPVRRARGHAGRVLDRRPGARRHRCAGARRAGGDLAGRPGRPVRPPGRPARRRPGRRSPASAASAGRATDENGAWYGC